MACLGAMALPRFLAGEWACCDCDLRSSPTMTLQRLARRVANRRSTCATLPRLPLPTQPGLLGQLVTQTKLSKWQIAQAKHARCKGSAPCHGPCKLRALWPRHTACAANGSFCWTLAAWSASRDEAVLLSAVQHGTNTFLMPCWCRQLPSLRSQISVPHVISRTCAAAGRLIKTAENRGRVTTNLGATWLLLLYVAAKGKALIGWAWSCSPKTCPFLLVRPLEMTRTPVYHRCSSWNQRTCVQPIPGKIWAWPSSEPSPAVTHFVPTN